MSVSYVKMYVVVLRKLFAQNVFYWLQDNTPRIGSRTRSYNQNRVFPMANAWTLHPFEWCNLPTLNNIYSCINDKAIICLSLAINAISPVRYFIQTSGKDSHSTSDETLFGLICAALANIQRFQVHRYNLLSLWAQCFQRFHKNNDNARHKNNNNFNTFSRVIVVNFICSQNTRHFMRILKKKKNFEAYVFLHERVSQVKHL